MSGRNKVILAGIGLSLIGVLVFVAPFEGISRGEAIALGVVLLVLIAMVGNGERTNTISQVNTAKPQSSKPPIQRPEPLTMDSERLKRICDEVGLNDVQRHMVSMSVVSRIPYADDATLYREAQDVYRHFNEKKESQ